MDDGGTLFRRQSGRRSAILAVRRWHWAGRRMRTVVLPPQFLHQGTCYARDYFAHRLDSIVGRRPSRLAAQPQLGLWPHGRFGPGIGDCAHLVAVGLHPLLMPTAIELDLRVV